MCFDHICSHYPLLVLSHASKISPSQHVPPPFVHSSKWTTKFDYGYLHDHGCEINYRSMGNVSVNTGLRKMTPPPPVVINCQ